MNNRGIKHKKDHSCRILPQRPPTPPLLVNWLQTCQRVQTPLGISKRSIIYSTCESRPHLELGQGENLQTIHSSIFKNDEIPLFPNLPYHNNPHTPPIIVNLLRGPTQDKLIEMGACIPMIYWGLKSCYSSLRQANRNHVVWYLTHTSTNTKKFSWHSVRVLHPSLQWRGEILTHGNIYYRHWIPILKNKRVLEWE